MWSFIKMMVAIYVGLAGIFAFINIFYIKGYIVGFVLHSPFYITAWAYLIITIRNEYKRDKELKAKEEQESKDR